MQAFWITAILLSPWVLACQEKNLEGPTSPLSAGDPAAAVQSSDDATVAPHSEEEQVIPPVQITGTWLVATVLEEVSDGTSVQARIAVEYYYNGRKVAEDPLRYQVTLEVSSKDPALQVMLQTSNMANYDRLILVTGSNQDQVRNAYAAINVKVTIVDTTDGSTDTLNTVVSETLDSIEPMTTTTADGTTTTNTTRNRRNGGFGGGFGGGRRS
jgi:hypothetical protein